MAAKIRLKKVGRKGQPSYRIVVLDGKKPRDAKVVADLGFYDPKTDPVTFEVDGDAALKWLLDGAKATHAARDVLSKAGVMAAFDAAKRGEEVAIEKKELKPTGKKEKKAKEEAAVEAVEEPSEAVKEAEAEEKPVEEPAEEAPVEEEEPAAAEEPEAEEPVEEEPAEEAEEEAEKEEEEKKEEEG